MEVSIINCDENKTQPENSEQPNKAKEFEGIELSTKETVNTQPSEIINNPSYNDLSNTDLSLQKPTSESECFKVYVRYRPLTPKEKSMVNPYKKTSILKKEDHLIFLFDPNIGESSMNREVSYAFDDVFDEFDRNSVVFERTVLPMLSNVLNGYNCTVFAYGMTGAGKTHTMLGDLYSNSGELGIVALVVNELFAKFSADDNANYEFTLYFSYIEIYNEQVKDLLTDSKENLMIIEDSSKGVMVPNLTQHKIEKCADLVSMMKQGNARRKMAMTNSNQFSSRSHAIIQFIIEKRDRAKDVVDTYTQSKFLLIDLAGSERAAVSDNKGMRQIEGANINKSLLSLGNCINILSDPNKRGAFVPYRDSKLTRLLKDSLGGNTKTIMLACVSPCNLHYEETSNTLKYASRARRINRVITSNVKEVEMHISHYKEVIDSLKNEIELLRRQLNEKKFEEKISNAMNADQRNSLSSEALQAANADLEELGQKLLADFEESWEIRQSLNELEALQKQNEKLLQQHQEQNDEKGSPLLDIKAIQANMANNQKILNEMKEALEKNLEDRKLIQEKIANLSMKQEIKNSQEGLANLCRALNMEKMELQAENAEIKKEARILAKQRSERDERISKLEQEVERMKKKLEEKVTQLYRSRVLKDIYFSQDKRLQESDPAYRRMSGRLATQFKSSTTRTSHASANPRPRTANPDQNILTFDSDKATGSNKLTIDVSSAKNSLGVPQIEPHSARQSVSSFQLELDTKRNAKADKENPSPIESLTNLDSKKKVNVIQDFRGLQSNIRELSPIDRGYDSPDDTLGAFVFRGAQAKKLTVGATNFSRNARDSNLRANRLNTGSNKHLAGLNTSEINVRRSDKTHKTANLEADRARGGFSTKRAAINKHFGPIRNVETSAEKQSNGKKQTFTKAMLKSSPNKQSGRVPTLEDLLNSELNPEFHQPIVSQNLMKPTSMKQHKTLEQARETAKAFKVRIYSLLYAVENDLFDEAKCREAEQLIADYKISKPAISTGDQQILAKVEAAAAAKRKTLNSDNSHSPFIQSEISSPIVKDFSLRESSVRSFSMQSIAEVGQPVSPIKAHLSSTRNLNDSKLDSSLSLSNSRPILTSINEARMNSKQHSRDHSASEALQALSNLSTKSVSTDYSGKPKTIVQNLIEKQRKQLQEKFDRRNQNQNLQQQKK